MPNISRGRVATQWFETRHERKKEARQGAALTRLSSKELRDCRPWSEPEDGVVRRMYGHMTSKEIGALINRNYRTVQNRARVLGVAAARFA